MGLPNLTREGARRRAELLEIKSYRVQLELDEGDAEGFGSVAAIRFRCREAGAASWIDLVAEEVVEAVLNGKPLDVSGYRPEEGIVLPDLAEDNELVVRARCGYSVAGEGLNRFVDPVDQAVYLYTHFEPAYAQRMFACFDQPDLKAEHELTVIAPAGWKVVGNTPVEFSQPTPQGMTRHVFAATPRISTYLVALMAGPWAEWHDTHHDESATIPLGLYCRASLAPHMDAERLFTETKQGFAFFHRTIGLPYPFGKYDQCFVPEFSAGGMENAGCVTLLDELVFRSRVAEDSYERRCGALLHEMAHMWFGDLVTMRWWDDLWLNESFATFAGVLAQAEATEYRHAWTSFASMEKAWAYRQDQMPSTHPVVADVPDVRAVELNFDAISYAKGASLLRQLAAYVGRESFFAGLRSYLTEHAWGNASLSDLLRALGEACGRDLSWWSEQWLESIGLTTLRAEFALDVEGRFIRFAVTQSEARPGGGEPRCLPVAIGIYADDGTGGLVCTHRVETDVAGPRTEVPEMVGAPGGGLVLLNDDEVAYCQTRLDPGSLATLVERIGDITDPLARTMCWSTAWEMTRDAEFRARDFVKLVRHGLPAEADPGTVGLLLQRAHTALDAYGDPARARPGWREHITWLMDQATAAEPGSDRQLVLVGAIAVAVLDEDQLATVRGWLGGSSPLPDLALDGELRWRLTQALVAHDQAGDREIGAELERDATSLGRLHAERTRALMPSPQAKEEAWQNAFRGDLPTAAAESLASGFSHPAQRRLLEPFAPRYFAEIADAWTRWESGGGRQLAMLLFPSWAASTETVAAADTWLAEHPHPPSLHRLVAEGRDRMVRMLKARAFDQTA
ncbi:aminopeptidase N [Nonomuraea sp. NPDC049141]|uniref:aminopeptidase N n=1 Tax=Nonomuraea sp. NPDC049141 TaxID=3155500 RepID=UPI0033D722D7